VINPNLFGRTLVGEAYRDSISKLPARKSRSRNTANLLVIESKADMQKRGQASPDDGDALALTFAQAAAPPEKEEERDEEDEFGGNRFNGPGPGAWMR
jgi:hypothetical protein